MTKTDLAEVIANQAVRQHLGREVFSDANVAEASTLGDLLARVDEGRCIRIADEINSQRNVEGHELVAHRTLVSAVRAELARTVSYVHVKYNAKRSAR